MDAITKKTEKALEQQYFEEVLSWESDRLAASKASEAKAWKVALGSGIVAALAVLSLVLLMPLKTVEPFVVRVDNATGIVDVIRGLDEKKTTYNEAIDKYWLARYVTLRESYLYETVNADYRAVGLLSDPSQQKTYGELMSGRNPDSPLRQFGQISSAGVSVKSINFIDKDGSLVKKVKSTKKVALVRFSREVKRGGSMEPPTHWLATITYTYVNAPMKESDRLINPLGFQVVDYRVDPETVASKEDGKR